MNISFDNVVPIYIQIADAIEDDILSKKLNEGDNCYSQITIAKELNINPATAAKGIRLLVDRGILERVRGQAMTVKKGAVEMIRKRKINEGLGEIITTLVTEAEKLGIGEEEIIKMLRENFEKR